MAGIREQLREDLKTAMRARDALRRDTIRFLEVAVKNAEIEKRAPLNELEVLQLIQKQIKQRVAAAAQATIDRVGASGAKEKGKVMGPLVAELRRKTDGRVINEVVTEL